MINAKQNIISSSSYTVSYTGEGVKLRIVKSDKVVWKVSSTDNLTLVSDWQMISVMIFVLILGLATALNGNYWNDIEDSAKIGVLNNDDNCNQGKCSECVCPTVVDSNTCNHAYYSDTRFCKSTNCFCIINSTNGVGYDGPGTTRCFQSPVCCKDC